MNTAEFKAWCTAPKPILVPPCYRGRPLVMGILNITPDSFSDGGLCLNPRDALHQALKMIDAGADILDIGGESTRPGATPLSLIEELERVLPVIELIRARHDIAISIDTYKPAVMAAAVAAGASCINDVFALQKPGAMEMAASLDVPVCLMHMHGVPESMQEQLDESSDILLDIQSFFEARVRACLNVGLSKTQLILDPGFGFGKTVRQNLKITQHVETFFLNEMPVLLGVSRKSTIGAVLNLPVERRLPGSLALSTVAALKGVSILRTHDVAETRQALRMLDVMLQDSDVIANA